MNKQRITLEGIERQLDLLVDEPSSGGPIASFFKVIFQISLLPIVLFFVFSFLFGIAQVDEESMRPNFAEGDFVVFNRLEKEYSSGDIIIVFSENENRMVMQRIIACPGDTVYITPELQILVNDEPLRENWQTSGTLTQGLACLPISLQEGEYFVLSDNRTNSIDSRDSRFGNVDAEDIMGLVVYRFKMSK